MLQQTHVWNENNFAEAKEMWADGRSQGQIADFFGISTSAVAGFISRNREFFPKRKPETKAPRNKPTVWTDERLNKAAALWKAGRSLAEIAQTMGVTTYAVGNMMQKYRDLFPPARDLAQRARKAATTPKQQTPEEMEALFEKSGTKAAADGSRFILTGHTPVAFALLKAGQCKFPVSTPDEPSGPSMLCCGVSVDSGPFCNTHRLVAYRVRA